MRGIIKKNRLEIRMPNLPESRMTKEHTLDVEAAKIMSDPERLMRNKVATSFLSTSSRQGQKMRKKIDFLNDLLSSDDKGPPPVPDDGTKPALESLSRFFKPSATPHTDQRDCAERSRAHFRARNE